MRPVSLALQTPCSGRKAVFLYWMLFARSFGYGVFIRILLGHYRLTANTGQILSQRFELNLARAAGVSPRFLYELT
jgi:hypothetical protein